MKKKIISTIIMTILVFAISLNISYAATLTANLEITADKTQVRAGDTITFTFEVTDIANAAGNTVSAMEGVITYNTSFFETINPEDATGIVVNAENGMLSAAFSASTDKEIGTLQLKVKENPTGNGTVAFSALGVSDGVALANVDNKNFNIRITTTQVQSPGLTPGQEEIETLNIIEKNPIDANGNRVDTTVADEKIPQTGATPLLMGMLAVVGIVAVIIYKKYASFHDIK